MNAIEVNHLRRVYRAQIGVFNRSIKEVVAVDDISFEVKQGELFGLLGPNGAGKTTTVKMLTTLLIPTAGSASVAGVDVVKHAAEVRGRIGFIFGGERGLYWRLSGDDNLRYFASLYGVDPAVSKKRIPYLMELVGLKGRGNERVGGYSRGMKQRLHVARTLLHDPDILFLDEPTIGLDPVGAREFRNVILDLQSQKKTILLTTHYMFEADALSERIAIINKGCVIAMDTPSGLKKHVSDLSVVEVETFGASESALEKLRALPFVDSLSVEDREQKQMLMVQTTRGAEAVPDVMTALEGQRVGRVIVREPTLEDAYVRLVGGPIVNYQNLFKYWRTVLVVAEMSLRTQFSDGFVIFGIIFQPMIIAILALFMLKAKGGDFAMFVVVGSGLTGLWSSLLFVSGNSINSERWTGTLESLVGMPTPFEVIVFGKNLANVLQSLLSMVSSYTLAALLFGYSLTLTQPLLFFITLLISMFAFICFGLTIAPVFIMYRSVQQWENAMEFPVYIICGFLFPIALLPNWTTPLSYLLPPYWAAIALHGTSTGGMPFNQLLFSWAMMIVFSLVDLVIASQLFKIMLYKARVDATLDVD